MAENTFAVTQGEIGKPAKTETVDWDIFTTKQKAVLADLNTRMPRTLVSSGKPVAHNQIRIVDDHRCDLPERFVGEIAIQSDSLFSGYYHRPDLTRQVLEQGWYFTGDIGYMADGHLFVTGRKKDIIIVAGKNIYPQDIEEIVSSLDGVHPGRTVAFGIYSEQSGTEEVIVLAETEVQDLSKQSEMKMNLARLIRERLECIVSDIAFLPHMSLLKSSSGKISRSSNREKYLKEIKGEKG